MIALLVFWVSLGVVVYIYFGYPLLLWTVSRLRPRPVREGDVEPSVTFIVPAYNEEKVIAGKIENCLSLDYPPERVEVIVASNGSVDRTEPIVRGWGDRRVKLLALPSPGKVEALNEAVRAARGEILVFTDADFFLERHSLREIGRKFADPEVGGVCGARNTAIPRGGDATGEGEGMYHRWDKWQKIRESRIGSVFAADGLLYAIRRELYVPVTDPSQSDDIAISTRVVLQGYRLLYESRATAWEADPVYAREEFPRKIRVTNHSVRALLGIGRRLFTSGFYSVELLSHKLVRHFVPFFLIPLFASNLLLARTAPFYMWTMAGQVAVYGLAIAGAAVRGRTIGRSPLLTIPYYFCFVNAAALVGIVSILSGRKLHAWSPRSGEGVPVIPRSRSGSRRSASTPR